MSIETRLHAVEEYLKILGFKTDQVSDNKVNRTGDTMTGSLYFTGANNQSVGCMVNNNGENFDCGWDYSNGGAGMGLRSPNYGGSDNHGEFDIYARSQADEAYTKHLIGKANGALTWGGERIVINDGWYNSISYKSSTSYAGRGNIAIPTNGLYRVRASYSNSAVLTLGYGGANNTNPAATIILMDASFGGSLEVVTYIPAGTYKFWTKCGSNGANNNIILYRLMTLT